MKYDYLKDTLKMCPLISIYKLDEILTEISDTYDINIKKLRQIAQETLTK
jgi:hypothetical protein